MTARPEAQVSAAGIVLLLDTGCRPSAEQIHEIASSLSRTFISFDPLSQEESGAGTKVSETAPTENEERWLEVLRDGLTFDLLGLSPGPAVIVPAVRHSFGPQVEADAVTCQAIGLFPGPHLAEGAHTLPVVRTLLALSAELVGALEGVRSVIWSPSGSALHPDLFVQLVTAWLDGGAFPAPGLIGFDLSENGSLATDGLAFLTDRELVLDPALSAEPARASRLASRIIHDLVGRPPDQLPETVNIPGWPEIVLRDDPNHGVIRAAPS